MDFEGAELGVILFMSDAKGQEWTWTRLNRYMLGYCVNQIESANSLEYFQDAMRYREGWDVLVTDSNIAALHEDVLKTFLSVNPSAVVCIMDEDPAQTPFPEAIMWNPPEEGIDGWLAAMYGLFRRAMERRNAVRGKGHTV